MCVLLNAKVLWGVWENGALAPVDHTILVDHTIFVVVVTQTDITGPTVVHNHCVIKLVGWAFCVTMTYSQFINLLLVLKGDCDVELCQIPPLSLSNYILYSPSVVNFSLCHNIISMHYHDYSCSHMVQITDFLEYLHEYCKEKSETCTKF